MAKPKQKPQQHNPSPSPSQGKGKKPNQNKTPETIREEKKKNEQKMTQNKQNSENTQYAAANDDDDETTQPVNQPNATKTPNSNTFSSPQSAKNKKNRGRSSEKNKQKDKEKKTGRRSKSPRRSTSPKRTAVVSASKPKQPNTNPKPPPTPHTKQQGEAKETLVKDFLNPTPEDPLLLEARLRQTQHETRVNAAAAFPEEPFYGSDTTVPEEYRQTVANAIIHEAADRMHASPGEPYDFLISDLNNPSPKDDEEEEPTAAFLEERKAKALRSRRMLEASTALYEKETAEYEYEFLKAGRRATEETQEEIDEVIMEDTEAPKDSNTAEDHIRDLEREISALQEKKKLLEETKGDTVEQTLDKQHPLLESQQRLVAMSIDHVKEQYICGDWDKKVVQSNGNARVRDKLKDTPRPSKRPTPTPFDPENITARLNHKPPPRPYSVRVDIKLRTEPSDKPQAALKDSITRLFEILQDVDKHVAIYPFDPNEVTVRDMFKSNKGSESDVIQDADKIPSSTYDIQRYFKGIRANSTDKEGGDSYSQVWLGLSKPFVELSTNCSQTLRQIKFGMWESDLQVASTVKAGWLVYSHRNIILKTLKAEIIRITGIEVGLRWKVIAGQKWDKNIDNKDKIRAIHIELDERYAAEDSTTIHDLFATDKTATALFPLGIHMRVVPEMSTLTSLEEKAKATYLRTRQQVFCDGLMHKNTLHLEFLDLVSSTFGVSLRSILMDISTDEGDQVFHSINTHWNPSEGHIVSFAPKMEKHATTILSSPLTFLRHRYDDASHPALQKMFSPWTVRKANKSTWDPETGTVVTQELTHMNELVNGTQDAQWDFTNIDIVKEDAEKADLQKKGPTEGGLQNVPTPLDGSIGADSKTTFRGEKGGTKRKSISTPTLKKVTMDSSVKDSQPSLTPKDDGSMIDTLSSYVTLDDLDLLMNKVADENKRQHAETAELNRQQHAETAENNRMQLEASMKNLAEMFTTSIDSAMKTVRRSELPAHPPEKQASTPRAGTGSDS